jgi:uncharacterized membrane protein
MNLAKHILLLVLILFFALTVGAQVKTGKIKGVVVDYAGGVLPTTKITIKSEKTKHELTTSDLGEFEIELPVGTYQVVAKKGGYKHGKLTQVEITEGATNTIKIKLVPNGDQNIY